MSTVRATLLAHRVSLRWLVGLRWIFIAGAVAAVVVAGQLLHLALPVVAIGAVIAVAAASNLGCAMWLRRRPVVGARAVAAVLLLDGVLVGAVLWLSGGIENPFVLSYVVLVVIASALLGRRAAVGALAGSIVAVALLSASARPLVLDHVHERGDHHGGRLVEDPAAHLRLHAEGSWAALAIVALLVIYLVDGVLRRREAEVAVLVAERQRDQKLADLGAMAAQAAHELGTPLSTIAVVSRELERAIERGEATTLEDVRTIRAEVERCRAVLAEIARRGRGEGEAPARFALGDLLTEARSLAPAPGRVEVAVGDLDLWLFGPRTAIVQVVRGLLANAQEAAPGPVMLSARREGASCRIEISDRGPGISREVVRRAGEAPLPSARGMGMGLFLSRAILERVGGRIELAPGATGTTARLFLPLAPEGS